MITKSRAEESRPHSENLLLAFAMIVITGPLSGALFLAITYHYQLIYFSALIPALCAFVAICFVIWEGRIRGRLFSIVLGFLLCLIIYASYQGLRYIAFRQVVADGFEQEYGSTLSSAELQRLVDNLLLDETGTTGFLGYVRYEMRRGMVIRSTPLPLSAYEVTGTNFLFYWLYDALIILAGALLGAWWANGRAYCAHCNKYYGRIKNANGDAGLRRLGWLEKEKANEFARLLDMQHFEHAGTLLQRQRPPRARLDVQVERCESCTTNLVSLFLYQARGTLSSRQSLFGRHNMSAEDYHRLTAFATVDTHPPRLSSASEWFIGMLVVVGFLAGLMFLVSLTQSI